MLPPPSDDNRIADLERRIADLETALTSAFTTISGGRGLTITDGGQVALVAADGTVIFYIGPVNPPLPDGTPQPGWIVRRADGTAVLDLFDAFPQNGPGGVKQALNWRDRGGNVVLADDTDSGQGIARPWLAGGFARARFADMTVTTTSSSFETLFVQYVDKQQPRLQVTYRATMDTAGTTGETRVMVNGTQIGATVSESFLNAVHTVGPLAVAGVHTSELLVEIQARRTSATGALRVEAYGWRGRQT